MYGKGTATIMLLSNYYIVAVPQTTIASIVNLYPFDVPLLEEERNKHGNHSSHAAAFQCACAHVRTLEPWQKPPNWVTDPHTNQLAQRHRGNAIPVPNNARPFVATVVTLIWTTPRHVETIATRAPILRLYYQGRNTSPQYLSVQWQDN